MAEKLEDHPETVIAGFVVDIEPQLTTDMNSRIDEIESAFDVEIPILSLNAWVDLMLREHPGDVDEFLRQWFLAFTESICQERREIAPIDEPCDRWVADLLIRLSL